MKCPVCADRTIDSALTIQGRPAVHGCVEGIVRVILHPHDADQVAAGEVLVTPMTDPDSVPAMERSAAVVTDRGGVLCHAAIVCREMNKACVVGTKDATVKLRDGWQVRVCATRGLVLVIQQAPAAA